MKLHQKSSQKSPYRFLEGATESSGCLQGPDYFESLLPFKIYGGNKSAHEPVRTPLHVLDWYGDHGRLSSEFAWRPLGAHDWIHRGSCANQAVAVLTVQGRDKWARGPRIYQLIDSMKVGMALLPIACP